MITFVIASATYTPEYRSTVRFTISPLLNSGDGNGAYDYVSLGDNEYPDAPPPVDLEADPNALDGYKYSPYGLYETAGTLNSSWGFKYYDQNWITSEEIKERRSRLNGLGVNYLLNVGPDAQGRIPEESVKILTEIGAWMDKNSESIYGCEGNMVFKRCPYVNA